LILFLVSSTGRGLKEILTEWDFPRLDRWIEYCTRHPPLQIMIASYLGVGDAKKNAPLKLNDDNFQDFMSMLSAESKVNG
jgi:hypothetical protein